uniref:Uncharacterized protein n=2 Tax=Rhizophagus irregularis TaxID=588596 RepID=U9T1L9_RHIID
MAADALIATRMNLSPGGAQPKMRDGWYIDKNGEKQTQLMVLEVLISVSVTTIRKFARKSWKYMDAYNKGLEGRTAEWAVNKYKSHRRLPENIERIMDQLDNT